MLHRALRRHYREAPPHSSALHSHYDADHPAMGWNKGDYVQVWRDINSDRTLEQADSLKRPEYRFNSTMGRNVLYFRGGSAKDHIVSPSWWPTRVTGTMTFILVMQAYDNSFAHLVNGAHSDSPMIWRTDSGELWMGAHATSASISGGVIDTAPHILRCQFGITSSNFFVDGVLQTNGDAGQDEGMMEAIQISKHPTSDARYFNGDIGELQFHETIVSDSACAEIEEHLSEKWSIPLG